MKRILYLLILLVSPILVTHAQLGASMTDYLSISIPVFHPRNASSATLFSHLTPTDPILYAHSWDGTDTTGGIGWGVSKQVLDVDYFEYGGFIDLPNAKDIDVVIFKSGINYYILAAFYINNGVYIGHYFNIYQYNAALTTPALISSMVPLSSSTAFGRINVDANENGVAVIWHVPGSGIFMKASNNGLTLNSATPIFVTGSDTHKDPDICIGDVLSSSNLYVTSRRFDNKIIVCSSIPLATAIAGISSFTPEYSIGAAGTNLFGVPRIDCPDSFGVKKWTVAYAMTSGLVNETIKATVFNGTAFNIDVHPLVTYSLGSAIENLPVLSYSPDGLTIEVGWITKNNTIPIPGTTHYKYLAKTINDPGGTPFAIPSSYKMISGTSGGTDCPALAFSSVQFTDNRFINYHRLHTVYTHRGSGGSFYNLMYKSKRWTSGTFRHSLAEEKENNYSVFPNPFGQELNITVPQDDEYQISITNMEGKAVFHESMRLVQGRHVIGSDQISAGIYFIRIQSAQSRDIFTSKIVKID